MGALRHECNACVMCQICSKIENGSRLNFCARLFQRKTGCVAKFDVKKSSLLLLMQYNTSKSQIRLNIALISHV